MCILILIDVYFTYIELHAHQEFDIFSKSISMSKSKSKSIFKIGDNPENEIEAKTEKTEDTNKDNQSCGKKRKFCETLTNDESLIVHELESNSIKHALSLPIKKKMRISNNPAFKTQEIMEIKNKRNGHVNEVDNKMVEEAKKNKLESVCNDIELSLKNVYSSVDEHHSDWSIHQITRIHSVVHSISNLCIKYHQKKLK